MSQHVFVTLIAISVPAALWLELLVVRVFAHWWWMRRHYRPVVVKRSERWQR